MSPSIDSLYKMIDGFFAANSGAPAAPTPVRPIRRMRCTGCGGDGYVEIGMDEFSNLGRSVTCSACHGSGAVDVEVKS